MKRIIVILNLIFFSNCSISLDNTFNSQELVSSSGEKIYVNSLNWGVTDDHQISIISSDMNRVKEIFDTLNVVRGLEPFIYSFQNDSLKLFFNNEISFKINEHFESIKVSYIVLNTKTYNKLRKQSYDNDGYFSIPKRKEIIYPTDMPKPPKD